MDPNVIIFALVAAVTLLASYVQGGTGFGFGVLAMIFLPHLLSYTEASLLSTVLSSLSSLLVACLLWHRIHWKNIIFPVLGCLVSTYVAVSFIKAQSPQVLILILGIALFALSMYLVFFTDKIKIRPTWYAGLIAGIVSGIMSGMFAIGGPPVVIYFMQSEEDSDTYLSTISAYFVLSGIVSAGTKVAAGFLTDRVWVGFAVGLLAMIAGSFLGKRTRDYINPKMIKRIVYVFMAISGIINVVTSLI